MACLWCAQTNLGQVCIQGGGGRPFIEEGKVQSNAQNMKRSRVKADEVKVKLVQSYTQLVQEKDELSLRAESNFVTSDTRS